ncbi:MAG: trypsin-like peptidase domain-containing protein [Chitinophagaceae bacterium]
MKTLFLFLQLILFSFLSYAQLNTRLIASKYGSGIVKIINMDTSGNFLSRGTGFFVTNDGYIFTNRHVIFSCVDGFMEYYYLDAWGKEQWTRGSYSEALSDKFMVKAIKTGYTIPIIQVFYGNEEKDYKLYLSEVVSLGTGSFDGAILKVVSDIEGHRTNLRFNAVPLGNSDSVQQGERFCVFGYPAQTDDFRGKALLEDMSTLSTGVMSGYDFNFNKDYGFIKTDAKIDHGNSGGPVFNETNKVIGIATAGGPVTNIGLIGGINGMYYVAASDSKIHNQLIAKGLKAPSRAMSINTSRGDKLPIKSADEINTLLFGVGKSNQSTTTQNKGKVRVYFSNVTPYMDAPPGVSQQYASFNFDKRNNNTVYIYVDNNPNPLNTNVLYVYVFKRSHSGKYEKFKNLDFKVDGRLDYVYFPFEIKEKGNFQFDVYSQDNVFLGSGWVEFLKK